jgi:hypothetical protein
VSDLLDSGEVVIATDSNKWVRAPDRECLCTGTGHVGECGGGPAPQPESFGKRACDAHNGQSAKLFAV